MKKIILLVILQLSLFGFGQAPSIEWQKCLGGNSTDYGNVIQQTSDGGYILAGDLQSSNVVADNNTGCWIVKLNNTGTIEWQQVIGENNSYTPRSIKQTTDGGYIIAGTIGFNMTADYRIVKLNSLGVIEWQKSFGGTADDVAYDIQQTTDGGYVVAGETNSYDGDVSGNHGQDCWIVKLDNLGTIQWQKCLGGTNVDKAFSIQQTIDGGYIVGGYTTSNNGDVSGNHGAFDYWIVKLNNLGIIVWQKCLGGTSSDIGRSIQATTDGGYIVAGNTFSNNGDVSGNHGSWDGWIVKLSGLGIIEWQKCLGGTSSDFATVIQQTTDGGYVVAGQTASNDGDVSGNHGGDGDYWLVKLNNLGSIIWQKCLGGSSFDSSTSMQQTIDGGYVVFGESSSNDGDVTGNHGAQDFWVVKLSPETVTTPPTANPQTFCNTAIVNDLVATGDNLKWYSVAINSSPLSSNTVLVSGTYYVSQTINGVESARVSVAVTVKQIVTPTFTAVSAICAGGTLSTLPTISNNGISGIWSPPLNNLATTTYTFTPSIEQCGNTTTLTITVGTVPIAPTGEANQNLFFGSNLTDISFQNNSGGIVEWYSSQANAIADVNKLELQTQLINGSTYYGVSKLGNCRSNNILEVTVSLQPTVPDIDNVYVSNITSTSATINYVVNPNGADTNVTVEYFQLPGIPIFFLQYAYSSVIVSGISATNGSITIPNLWPNSGYKYKIYGSNYVGNSFTSGFNLSFVTLTGVAPNYQTLCSQATVNDLQSNPNYSNIKWYNTQVGGTPLSSTTTLIAGNYYVTGIINNVESAREVVVVTLNSIVAPTFTSITPICAGANLAALPTTSINGISGSWSPALNNLATTTYTFTPTAGQCANTQTMTITVNPNITPSVSIAANPGNSITTGTSVTFTATPTNGGTTPIYQWKKNSNNVGTNSVTYTDANLENGDFITCILTSNEPCASPSTATSTGITMAVTYPCPAGTTWTSRTSSSNNSWNSVTFGNGLFVAVSLDGTGNGVMTSPDGITWTSRVSAADNDWRSVTYGNGLFVAVSGNSGVMTSPDGTTWTSRTPAAYNFWFSVTYGNGLFVAVSGDGTGNRVMTSPNGINWTSRTSAVDNQWKSVTYGNGLFVAVSLDGTGNRVMTSPDGITWTIRTSAADNYWQSVTYGNGLFVAVSNNGAGNKVMTSPDGINWTIRSSAVDNFWSSVTYGNGLFVAVAYSGSGNRVMTSPDGITWTSRNSTVDNHWLSVTYGNGVFVVVSLDGPGNRVMTSSSLFITPAFTQVSAICSGATLSALPTTSTNAITGTWSPALNNTATTLYTFTPNVGQCATTQTMTITVTPQPVQPVIACYQFATFNTSTCSWEVTGTQPIQPTLACYETAIFNDSTCSWDVTGTQPEQPTLACYESATFNTSSCSWDVTGTQPLQPTLACYESATFNTSSCTWEVTGIQPTQPTLACYETAIFNDSTCSWDVTGTQPVQPTLACYETATFNTTSCTWDVTGTQPIQPPLACYETATFNTTSCSWDVTGTAPAVPTGDAVQTLSVAALPDATIANLIVSPTNVIWYASLIDAQIGISPLQNSSVLTSGATYYAVNGTIGCTSNPFAVTVSVTLGASTFGKTSIQMYPNPTSSILKFQTQNNIQIDKIIIFDLTGKKVLEQLNANLVNVANLAQGLYVVQAFTGEEKWMSKFVKE